MNTEVITYRDEGIELKLGTDGLWTWTVNDHYDSEAFCYRSNAIKAAQLFVETIKAQTKRDAR